MVLPLSSAMVVLLFSVTEVASLAITFVSAGIPVPVTNSSNPMFDVLANSVLFLCA